MDQRAESQIALLRVLSLPASMRAGLKDHLSIVVQPVGNDKWWALITCPGDNGDQTVYISQDYNNESQAFEDASDAYWKIIHKLRMP